MYSLGLTSLTVKNGVGYFGEKFRKERKIENVHKKNLYLEKRKGKYKNQS